MERSALVSLLLRGGYQQVEFVESIGEFSIRGGILDLFAPEMAFPLRIEFFGDTVESIRLFDPENQRTFDTRETAMLLPVRELIAPAEGWEAWAATFRNQNTPERESQTQTAVPDKPSVPSALLMERCDLFARGIFPPGIENWGPLVYGNMVTLFDYLHPDTLLVLDEPSQLTTKMVEYQQTIIQGYTETQAREGWVPLPQQLFLDTQTYGEYLEFFQRLKVSALSTRLDSAEAETLQGAVLGSYQGRWDDLHKKLWSWLAQDFRVIFAMGTPRRAKQLRRLLQEADIDTKTFPSYSSLASAWKGERLMICLGTLSTGFALPSAQYVLVEEKELFRPEKRTEPRGRRGRKRDALLRYRDLQVGDFLVHMEYGIGLYRGMKALTLGQEEHEVLEIEYADGDKLYIPFDGLHLVQKYLGAGAASPALSKLGGSEWKRTKKKVKEDMQKLAKDLIELYAARGMSAGFAFSADGEWHREFDTAFEYTETVDQYDAILDVKRDMESAKPMDRLICGDVGYGKTEVAMRAAFKAVMDGKQVAVLVPTTILAHQHLTTFQRRFASYPVTIEMLSRFRSPKEQQTILENLRLGNIDIIIGTHKLLQKDIHFHDLGLLIIDEEQRFGVKHKEYIKKLRKNVDVLTLTATPIPRTLHLSLVGIRDLSIIDTPPAHRLPIRTYIMRFGDQVIREAIDRELERGGQVFFVHNRVESIEAMYRYLKRVIPQARIVIAHGQLPEKTLETVMLQFLARQYDVLLCTTIIESGLDIPSVNTIIINRADKFGLAQLYQLRGRVGRDRIQAYAYLLIPGEQLLSDVAWKRLSAVLEYSELGAGFQLALRDMEIRGAGNILGTQQSGQIAAVGFDLYCKLMEETIRELKGESVPEEIDPKIQLGYTGKLPPEYVPTPNQRLELYQRLYRLANLPDLAALQDEIRDRYGPSPEAACQLFLVIEVRILAKKLAIEKIEKHHAMIDLVFHPSTPVTPAAIIHLLQEHADMAQFLPEHTLRVRLEEENWSAIGAVVKKLLHRLLERVSI
jgi:transcription-repair coupling factor (superfamily II helicase)